MKKEYIAHSTAVCAVVAALMLTGCEGMETVNVEELGGLAARAENCPEGQYAAHVRLDESGSTDAQIRADRMPAIRDAATQTAVCGGRLTVVAFAGSSADTLTLFDAPIVPPGATQNARLRKVGGLVEDAMGEIEATLEDRSAELADGVSDIAAQFDAMADFAAQTGADTTIDLLLLTDGGDTVVGVGRSTPAEIVAVADTLTVPELPATSRVTVAGLGRTASGAMPSAKVTALKELFGSLCRRSGAGTCTTTTDYVTE